MVNNLKSLPPFHPSTQIHDVSLVWPAKSTSIESVKTVGVRKLKTL
jgi:hypothetical protein